MDKTRKQDSRIVRTKNAVRRAFLHLALSKRVSEITVSEIALIAKINRTTFYLHYKSVEDIYNDIVLEHTNECKAIVNAHKEELSDFHFESCADEFVKYYDEYFGIKSECDSFGFIPCLKDRVSDIMCEAMLELYNTADMRDRYVIVSQSVLSGLLYGWINILSEWMDSDRKSSLYKLCREYSEVIVNGIKKW